MNPIELEALLSQKQNRFHQAAIKAAKGLTFEETERLIKFDPYDYAHNSSRPSTIRVRIKGTSLSGLLDCDSLSISGFGVTLRRWQGRGVKEVYDEAIKAIVDYEERHPVPF